MVKAIETQINKHNINMNFDVSKYGGADGSHVNNNKKSFEFF